MSKYCPNCGKENNDKATFCLNCGSTFPNIKKEKTVKPKQNKTKQKSVTEPDNSKIKKILIPLIIIIIIATILIGSYYEYTISTQKTYNADTWSVNYPINGSYVIDSEYNTVTFYNQNNQEIGVITEYPTNTTTATQIEKSLNILTPHTETILNGQKAFKIDYNSTEGTINYYILPEKGLYLKITNNPGSQIILNTFKT